MYLDCEFRHVWILGEFTWQFADKLHLEFKSY